MPTSARLPFRAVLPPPAERSSSPLPPEWRPRAERVPSVALLPSERNFSATSAPLKKFCGDSRARWEDDQLSDNSATHNQKTELHSQQMTTQLVFVRFPAKRKHLCAAPVIKMAAEIYNLHLYARKQLTLLENTSCLSWLCGEREEGRKRKQKREKKVTDWET
ncbi:uncharacterized protein LOC112541622 isoform X2 [Python bivittatus]|uniref:Uncharacterized protein LOC112541622 isoform X2 n=1 Tax=Python bivittatus TaxID=176946 RepID=A0A9F5N1Z9_PYTBI|nr:uncharacterized protein LOC112541622 isoform X2 [Python bivittatus]